MTWKTAADTPTDGFDFDWDNDKVHGLKLKTQQMPMKDLDWHLATDFWGQKDGEYGTRPNDVLAEPHKHPVHAARIAASDTSFPIHVMKKGDKHVILDGLHRLAKLKKAGVTSVAVKVVPASMLHLIKTGAAPRARVISAAAARRPQWHFLNRNGTSARLGFLKSTRAKEIAEGGQVAAAAGDHARPWRATESHLHGANGEEGIHFDGTLAEARAELKKAQKGKSLLKVGAVPGSKEQHQALHRTDAHFSADSTQKTWDTFVQNAKRKSFVEAVQQDHRSDPKLEQHVDQMNRLQTGKTVGTVQGQRGKYRIVQLRGEDTLGCTCPDWRYTKSVAGVGQQDCKHIRAFKKEHPMIRRPTKTASAGPLLTFLEKEARTSDENIQAALDRRLSTHGFDPATGRVADPASLSRTLAQREKLLNAGYRTPQSMPHPDDLDLPQRAPGGTPQPRRPVTAAELTEPLDARTAPGTPRVGAEGTTQIMPRQGLRRPPERILPGEETRAAMQRLGGDQAAEAARRAQLSEVTTTRAPGELSRLQAAGMEAPAGTPVQRMANPGAEATQRIPGQSVRQQIAKQVDADLPNELTAVTRRPKAVARRWQTTTTNGPYDAMMAAGAPPQVGAPPTPPVAAPSAVASVLEEPTMARGAAVPVPSATRVRGPAFTGQVAPPAAPPVVRTVGERLADPHPTLTALPAQPAGPPPFSGATVAPTAHPVVGQLPAAPAGTPAAPGASAPITAQRIVAGQGGTARVTAAGAAPGRGIPADVALDAPHPTLTNLPAQRATDIPGRTVVPSKGSGLAGGKTAVPVQATEHADGLVPPREFKGHSSARAAETRARLEASGALKSKAPATAVPTHAAPATPAPAATVQPMSTGIKDVAGHGATESKIDFHARAAAEHGTHANSFAPGSLEHSHHTQMAGVHSDMHAVLNGVHPAAAVENAAEHGGGFLRKGLTLAAEHPMGALGVAGGVAGAGLLAAGATAAGTGLLAHHLMKPKPMAPVAQKTGSAFEKLSEFSREKKHKSDARYEIAGLGILGAGPLANAASWGAKKLEAGAAPGIGKALGTIAHPLSAHIGHGIGEAALDVAGLGVLAAPSVKELWHQHQLAKAPKTAAAPDEGYISTEDRASFRVRTGATCSLKRDQNGFYCATQRARSKSYPTAAAIPVGEAKRICATG